MNTAFSICLTLSILLCTTLSGTSIFGQQANEKAYEDAQELIRSTSNKKRADIFQRYSKAVERLQTKLQQSGDLENALKARDELEKAESQELAEVEFPGILPLREVLQRELAKIDSAEKAKLKVVQQQYLKYLKARVFELTTAGELEEAIRLDTQRKELEEFIGEAQSVKTEPNIPTPNGRATQGAGVTLPPAPREPSGKLDDDEDIFGELIISGGKHRIREEIFIGRRKENIESEKGFLTIQDRAEVRGGGFFGNFGRFKVESARLEEVAIREELQSSFSAEKSIFQDCTFKKGGGWGVNWYGSKWVFNECVIEGAFFTRWTSSDVGIKLTNCTFYDVEFPAFPWKQSVTKETASEWRKIENCLFVECEIPISVLLATTNCVFENCHFVEDEVHDNGALYDKTEEKEVSTVVYWRGDEEPEIPSPNPKYTFTFRPPPEALKNAGCPAFYTFNSSKVEFR